MTESGEHSKLSKQRNDLVETPNNDEGTMLYVSNLTRNVTNEHLAEIFSIYGPVESAEIEKDSRVGLSKGSAYVTFKKSKDMNHAMLHLDGAQLDGNVIKATFVLVANKRRREPSPGRKRRSNSPRGTRLAPGKEPMREAEMGGRNFDGGRNHHDRDKERDFGGGGGRDGRSGYREDNSHADRGRGGYGGRSQGVNNASRGPFNSGGARDGQYGPGGGGGGDRGNAYGPGSGGGRDRVDSQGPNRTQMVDRGGDRAGDRGSRRRSPSPVRRRLSRSPVRGGSNRGISERGPYQPIRRDPIRGDRRPQSRSRSRGRNRSLSSSRSSSRSSRSSSSRSRSSRSSSGSRSPDGRKGGRRSVRSSSASSSRSRSRDPRDSKATGDDGEGKAGKKGS